MNDDKPSVKAGPVIQTSQAKLYLRNSKGKLGLLIELRVLSSRVATHRHRTPAVVKTKCVCRIATWPSPHASRMWPIHHVSPTATVRMSTQLIEQAYRAEHRPPSTVQRKSMPDIVIVSCHEPHRRISWFNRVNSELVLNEWRGQWKHTMYTAHTHHYTSTICVCVCFCLGWGYIQFYFYPLILFGWL